MTRRLREPSLKLVRNAESLDSVSRAVEVAGVDAAQELDLHDAKPPWIVWPLEGDGPEPAQRAGAVKLEVIAIRELDGDGVRGAAEAVARGEDLEHRAIARRVAILRHHLAQLDEQRRHAHA